LAVSPTRNVSDIVEGIGIEKRMFEASSRACSSGMPKISARM